MPEIIAFVSPKGGCGATAVCAGVWHSLAKTGKNILAVDCCCGKCTLDFALGMQNDSVYDAFDVASGSCSLDDAVCSLGENAFFLRGSEEITDIGEFKDFIEKSSYDFVLLDIPPYGLDISDLHGKLWDKLVVITDCSQISAKLCGKFTEGLDTQSIYAVINKIIPSYIKDGIFPTADEILDDMGIYPLGLIPWSLDIVAASARGFSPDMPQSSATQAFDNISRRILGESVPAIDFDKVKIDFKNKKSFINKLTGGNHK